MCDMFKECYLHVQILGTPGTVRTSTNLGTRCLFHKQKVWKKAVFGALPGLNLGTKNGPKIETATIGVSKNGAGKRPQTVNTKTTFWNPVGAQPGADLRVLRVLQGTRKVGTETAAAVASMEL